MAVDAVSNGIARRKLDLAGYLADHVVGDERAARLADLALEERAFVRRERQLDSRSGNSSEQPVELAARRGRLERRLGSSTLSPSVGRDTRGCER
jgi:hypothetical protein